MLIRPNLSAYPSILGLTSVGQALALSLSLSLVLGGMGCSSLPTPKMKPYTFPKEEAFFKAPTRPYRVLGLVRSKADYQSLDPAHEETQLCKNYFNKAVRDLVKMAKDKGGDAVVDVKSVVFLEDGRREEYPAPECSDDGMEGQVLTQGIAIQWIQPKDQG